MKNRPAEGMNDWNFIWQNLSEGMSRNPGREYRFARILSLVPSDKRMRVLDFGCGTGNLLKQLITKYPQNEYFGADTSEAGVDATKLIAPSASIHKIELLQNRPSIETLQGEFDLIVCSEVIEHVENDRLTVQFLYSLLSADGLLVLTVPSGPMSKFDQFIGHLRHYSKPTLEALLKEVGFTNIRVERSGFPAINLLRLSTIFMGRWLISLLQKPSFGENGISKLFTSFLQRVFQFSLNDSHFGWQLVSVSKKP